jgi:hypothetical protein
VKFRFKAMRTQTQDVEVEADTYDEAILEAHRMVTLEGEIPPNPFTTLWVNEHIQFLDSGASSDGE